MDHTPANMVVTVTDTYLGAQQPEASASGLHCRAGCVQYRQRQGRQCLGNAWLAGESSGVHALQRTPTSSLSLLPSSVLRHAVPCCCLMLCCAGLSLTPLAARTRASWCSVRAHPTRTSPSGSSTRSGRRRSGQCRQPCHPLGNELTHAPTHMLDNHSHTHSHSRTKSSTHPWHKCQHLHEGC